MYIPPPISPPSLFYHVTLKQKPIQVVLLSRGADKTCQQLAPMDFHPSFLWQLHPKQSKDIKTLRLIQMYQEVHWKSRTRWTHLIWLGASLQLPSTRELLNKFRERKEKCLVSPIKQVCASSSDYSFQLLLLRWTKAGHIWHQLQHYAVWLADGCKAGVLVLRIYPGQFTASVLSQKCCEPLGNDSTWVRWPTPFEFYDPSPYAAVLTSSTAAPCSDMLRIEVTNDCNYKAGAWARWAPAPQHGSHTWNGFSWIINTVGFAVSGILNMNSHLKAIRNQGALECCNVNT